MTEREEYGKLADELDAQADRLADHSDSLGNEITDAREEHQRRRADAGVTPDWDDPDEDEDEDEDLDGDDKDEDDEKEDED
jgi:hypothetical protein